MFAARSRSATSRALRPLGAISGALLLAATVSMTVVTSAQADDSNGTSLGGVTVTPASGTWTDAPSSVTVGGTYTCPALPSANDIRSGAYLFITERGTESPVLPPEGSPAQTTPLYPVNGIGLGSVVGDDGQPRNVTSVFPGIFSGSPYWQKPDGSTFASVADLLGTFDLTRHYSLVSACAYLDSVTYTTWLLPDATGHVAAAWSPLTLSADKSGWTVGAVAADTSVRLAAVPGAASVTLTATVQSGGTTAVAAAGSVTFAGADGVAVGTAAVANGVARYALNFLTPGQTYGYTATYVPDAGAEFTGSTSTTTSVTIAVGAPVEVPEEGTELPSDGAVVPGTKYKVTAVAGSFTADDTVTAEIHSTPIPLSETSKALADGSTVYAFTAPGSLSAGNHQLILTDAHSKTVTVNFTVAADPAGGGTGEGGGSNIPVSFATDWVGALASTSSGVTGLFGMLIASTASIVAGWFYFWRRRGDSARTTRNTVRRRALLTTTPVSPSEGPHSS